MVEEVLDGRADCRDLRAAQSRLEIEDGSRRGDEKIAGEEHFADAVVVRPLETQVSGYRSAGAGMAAG